MWVAEFHSHTANKALSYPVPKLCAGYKIICKNPIVKFNKKALVKYLLIDWFFPLNFHNFWFWDFLLERDSKDAVMMYVCYVCCPDIRVVCIYRCYV